MSSMRRIVVTVGALTLMTLGVVAQRTPTRVYDESTPGLVLPTVPPGSAPSIASGNCTALVCLRQLFE